MVKLTFEPKGFDFETQVITEIHRKTNIYCTENSESKIYKSGN